MNIPEEENFVPRSFLSTGMPVLFAEGGKWAKNLDSVILP